MILLQILLSFAISFTVVAVATPFIRKLALRWKLGHKPNGRKERADNIPHVGGIGMAFATLLAVALSTVVLGDNGAMSLLTRILIPVALIVGLGIADDTKSLRASQKLTIQVLASIVLVLSGIQMFTGIAVLDQSSVFVLLLSCFYLVGISSSVNLVDGMDGLAAGLAAISSGTFGAVAFFLGAPALLFMAMALVGACLGFLIYNFPPGRIFMGDTGSMFLGIMLGIIACSFTMLQPTLNTFIGVAFILAIPMMDSLLAIWRRIALRTPIFKADSLHMHHVLDVFGFSTRQVLAILYSMQAVMAILGLLTVKGGTVPLIVGFVFLGVIFISFIRIMVATKERAENLSTKFASVPSLED